VPAIQDSYLGLAEETVYGTAVAPARFLELVSESITGSYERIESEGWRSGQRVLRKDRFEVNPKGAAGDIVLEVQDSNFGLLFKHALGTVALGTAVAGITPITATLADLKGKSLSVQTGRVDASGALNVFTYEGGKVASWELSSSVDEIVRLSLTMDFEKETIGAGAGAYAAGTPTYSATSQLFTFVSSTVQIGGTAVPVSEISIKGDNALKVDRYFSGNAGMKKEPLTEGLREITWSATCEFDGTSQVNRVAASVASGALAQIVTTFTTPQGGELTVTIPNARFDEGPANFDGANIISLGLSGKALEDGSVSPVTILYKTKDAAA
jgi:hypothetical protein